MRWITTTKHLAVEFDTFSEIHMHSELYLIWTENELRGVLGCVLLKGCGFCLTIDGCCAPV